MTEQTTEPTHGKTWELADYDYNEITGRATFAYVRCDDPSMQVTITRQQFAAPKSNWNPSKAKEVSK